MFSDTDGYEFLIVSLDNKQWQFEANSSDDRDEWVGAIEQQILNSLQVSVYYYCPWLKYTGLLYIVQFIILLSNKMKQKNKGYGL